MAKNNEYFHCLAFRCGVNMDYFVRSSSEIVYVDNGITVPLVIFNVPVNVHRELEYQACRYYDPFLFEFVDASLSIKDNNIVLYVENGVRIWSRVEIKLIEEMGNSVMLATLPASVVDAFDACLSKCKSLLYEQEIKTMETVKNFINQYRA